MSKRIHLCNGYHAEPGETPGHLHDVYTTSRRSEATSAFTSARYRRLLSRHGRRSTLSASGYLDG